MRNKTFNNFLLVLAVAILSLVLGVSAYAACPNPPTASMGINSGSSTSLAGLLVETKNNGAFTNYTIDLSEGEPGGGIKLLNSSYAISSSVSSKSWTTGSTYYIAGQSTACSKTGYLFLGYGSSGAYGNKYALDCKYSSTVPYVYRALLNKTTSTTGWWDYYLSSYGTYVSKARTYESRPADSMLSGANNDDPYVRFRVTNGRTTRLVYNFVPVPAYTLTYNANGGTGAPAAQSFYSGSSTTISSTAPTRTGYTFVGWNSNSTATGTDYGVGSRYSFTSSRTIYAEWGKSTPEHVTPASGAVIQPGTNNVRFVGKATNNSTTAGLGVGIKIIYRKVGDLNWRTFSSSASTCAASGVANSINVNGWKPDVSNGCFATSGSNITYPYLSLTTPGQYEWQVQSLVKPRTAYAYSDYTASRYFTIPVPYVACSISTHSPATGQSINTGTTLNFSMSTASAVTNSIRNVTDNVAIGTTSGSHTFNSVGTKTIQFACDGNDPDTEPDDYRNIYVTVSQGNRAPIVTLVSPLNGAGLSTSFVPLRAQVTDPDGDNINMEIFYQRDGMSTWWRSGVTSGPTVPTAYERIWNTASSLPVGTYWWYATANDGQLVSRSTTNRFVILPPTCNFIGAPYSVDAGSNLIINYNTYNATNATYSGAAIPIGTNRTHSISNPTNPVVVNVSAYGRTGSCSADVTINTLSCTIYPPTERTAPARVRFDILATGVAGPFTVVTGPFNPITSLFTGATSTYYNVAPGSGNGQYHLYETEGTYGAQVSSPNFRGGAGVWCTNNVVITSESDGPPGEVPPGGGI